MAAKRLNCSVRFARFRGERSKTATGVSNEGTFGIEAQSSDFLCDLQRFLRITGAQYRIDSNSKLSMFGEKTQALAKGAERFAAHAIGLDIVDGDLHGIQTRGVEGFDGLSVEQVAIAIHDRNHSPLSHMSYQCRNVRVQKRFSAGEGDEECL